MRTLQDMLGPTDEARQLQFRQYEAREAMYDVWNQVVREVGHDNSRQDPRLIAANAAYDKTVEDLVALLGPDIHCNYVDSDLYSAFSDVYKDRAGFRPRFVVTRAYVQDFLSKSAVA